MWQSVPDHVPDAGWIELDENGWGALIGWVAGPGNLRRSPVDDSARTVAASKTGPDGAVIEFEEAFTAQDRVIVDESANCYLADAGAAERPGGFRWFIRLPEQFAGREEFLAAITRAVYARDPKPVHPSDVRSAMEQVMPSIYEGFG